jgi:type I restriction enzyme S subunit
VSKEIEEKHERTRLRGGELLLTLVGTVGETAVVPEALKGWNTARAVGVIPVRADIGATWVRYVISSAGIQTRIGSRLNTTVQATLNLGDVTALPIPLPPERERSRIIQVIGALDDKIELNRRTNETLEAMARAIFQSWFVDFNPVRANVERRAPARLRLGSETLFPEGFHDSELGPIPNGWRVGNLDELAVLQRGFDITKDQQRPGAVPVVSSGGIASYHDTAAKKGPGVVLGRKGVVGSVWYVEGDYWPHDTTLWVKDFKGHGARFVYYFFKYNALSLTALDVGSANPTLNRNHVHGLRVLLPPRAPVFAFDNVAGAFLTKQAQYARESRELASLRDTLLPKLLSGELRVSDAERAVADAV